MLQCRNSRQHCRDRFDFLFYLNGKAATYTPQKAHDELAGLKCVQCNFVAGDAARPGDVECASYREHMEDSSRLKMLQVVIESERAWEENAPPAVAAGDDKYPLYDHRRKDHYSDRWKAKLDAMSFASILIRCC